MRWLVALLVLIAPGEAAAQSSELQQCVWRCLSGVGKGDNTSPAYHRCVNSKCAAGEPAAEGPLARLGASWITGGAADGVGYAGVDGRQRGTGLYYFCGNGQSFLRVVGVEGGVRALIVEVDGQKFPMRFEANAQDEPESRLPPQAPVLAALMAGRRVQVISYQRGPLLHATLAGADKALEAVISGC